jgi:hypothetical protein
MAAGTSGPLGSAFQAHGEIARGEQRMYEVIVPRGATSLRARLSEVSDAGADLDLYVLDCATPEKKLDAKPAPELEKGNKTPPAPPAPCAPRGKAATVDRNGEVEVLTPTPGRWVVVVDAYAVPSGRTSYSYLDVFTHPRLGAVAAADFPSRRDPGASWNLPAHVWVAGSPDGDSSEQSLPGNGRSLLARFLVTSSDWRATNGSGATLGSLDLPLGASLTKKR